MLLLLTPQATDAEFSLVYDGPGLQEGEMEVGDLAPALLGMCDLIGEATATATGGGAEIKLNVRAGFRRGSFVINLHLNRPGFAGGSVS